MLKGAEPGMIFNSVSGDLYDGVKGNRCIPSFINFEYIEWKDRGEGPGAPVAIYDSSSDIMSKQNQMQTTKIDYLMVIILKRLHHILYHNRR